MNTTTENQNGRVNTPTGATQPMAERYVSPEVNIYESNEGYVLEAELPGVSKDGLDISIADNTLTLVGRRAKTELPAQLLHRESLRADYRRVFELDPAIDAARVDAKLDQGVLTITLPKSERVKPRKVVVND